MSDKPVFVDTNILFYAHDRSAGEKHGRAKELIKRLWDRDAQPALSVQVLQELYVNLLRKNMPSKEAEEIVRDYLEWRVVDNDRDLLIHGIEERDRWQIPYRDGLILAAAKRSRVNILWSEDFNTGQDFGGIIAVNPLLDGPPA